ncbi:MAG: DUF58 domain-containing protein, partial [Planctomycetota bacterium]
FRDHRAYAHGDDLRYLDWNVFARHESLVTKRFEAEEAARLVLVMDSSSSMAAGDAGRLGAAARGLAVLGAVALGRGDVVHFISIPGGRLHTFHGRAHLPGLLATIGSVRSGGNTDLAGDLQPVLGRIKGRSLAAIASDFLDPRGAFGGIDLLRRRGWEVRALHPVSPSDLVAPPAGPVLLVDAETGEERAVDLDEAARERMREHTVSRLRAFRRALRSRRVPWVRLPTGRDSHIALLTALRDAGVLA